MGGERRMGIYKKYRVNRNDGTDAPGEKHHGCAYFVLDLVHDPYAKPAILAYARACRESHPALAEDLRNLARSSKFAGGRAINGVRCLGAKADNNFARCHKVYKGQKGWDFVGVRPFDGWVCPDCRVRFRRIFDGPGLPKPLGSLVDKLAKKLKRNRYNWKKAAEQNKRAFGSTKSMDGRFPI